MFLSITSRSLPLGAGCQRLTLVVAHVSPSGGLRRSC